MLPPKNTTYIKIILLGLFTSLLSCSKNQIPPALDLTINEGFKNPIGFYDATPNFSWKLPLHENVKSQSAYQVVVASDPKLLLENPDLWDSGKQQGDQSTYIPYMGKPIISRQKVFWTIKYWDQNNLESDWSNINRFELGLLTNNDWKAKWIGLNTTKPSDTTKKGFIIHKIQYLKKHFKLPDNIASARLYITAQGVFDAVLNKKNISDDVMPPGWTPYQKRIETLTYNVTDILQQGENTLEYTLAPGWYAGRLGWDTSRSKKINLPMVLSQLEVTFKDGTTKTIETDNTWKVTTAGPITFSEIYDGEIYNANLEFSENNKQEIWKSVTTKPLDPNIRLVPKRHHTVKIKDTLSSIAFSKTGNNTVIFDLGQNMVGVPLIKVPVKKGDSLSIRFSEMLLNDGTFYTKNYRSARSIDHYISNKNETIAWNPKFTFHGFRYVELSGYDDSKEPSKDWVTGLVQHSDFDQNGTFISSHKKLNQLQSNINWGLRGNFFDIPTDCPQRDERLGWTGDAQVFAPTSIFNSNVHAFWASWLQSMREEQGEKGNIPFVVPNVLQPDTVSSGWGDAAVIIPWELYIRTGDVKVLEENFEMMKRWVAFHQIQSDNHISKMHSFADWLQPYTIQGEGTQKYRGDTSKELIGTAYNAYVTKLTMKAAKILGKKEEQETYKALSDTIQNAFETHFFDTNGAIKDDRGTQTGYLLALGFDLLSKELRKKAIPLLIEKINAADNHLRTGFLGTPLLPKVLDDIGEIDLMYTILFKETYPSWFYSINQGATTMWERWNSYSIKDGYEKASMNSLNHYAYGAIGQWMYERIAGIAPLEPGYKKIRIAPIPGGPLTSASASYKTIYGKVSSSWKIKKGQFYLETIIPPNTSAEILIPIQHKDQQVFLNDQLLESNENTKILNQNNKYIKMDVSSGIYSFYTKYR